MMKLSKLMALALAAALLLTTPVLAAGYDDVLPGVLTLAGEKQVYAEASEAAAAVGVCAAGDTVEVISAGNGWVNISLNDGVTGWITADGVSTACYWTADNMAYINGLPGAPVALYKRAEADATSISCYYPGTIVQLVAAPENGFVKVRIGKSTGYLREQDVTDAAPCALPMTLIGSSVEDVELRSSVANNGKTLAAFPGGTTVALMGLRSDGWAHVIINGQVGFMKVGRLAPTPEYGDAFAGVEENEQGETVAATASDEAIICCPNANDTLSLRKRTDIGAPSIGEYYNGTVVKLLETAKDGWVKVQIAGQAEGYVQTSYLAMNGQNVIVCHQQMVVDNKSGTGLNMRSKPETDGKKIVLIPNGAEVTVIGQWHNEWYHVIYEGEAGFVTNRLSPIN